MSSRNVSISIRDVHVAYDTVTDQAGGLKGLMTRKRQRHERIHAVRGVTFDIHEGETLGIIGANGSGKSTLLAAMTGLLPIESGEIWVRSRPTLLGVGAVMRPALSGRRNIIVGGLALGLTLEQARAKVPEIIAFSGLGDAIDRPMRAYSSGMRARLMFAIATSTFPDILLIDEALAVGDAEFYERSQRRIEAIRAQAGTVVLVSHNHNEIRSSCDRVVWMKDGEVAADGEPDDVIDAYEDQVRDRIEAEPVSAIPAPAEPPAPPPRPTPRRDRTVTLHIGSNHTVLPIQRYLVDREEELSERGLSIPSFLRRTSHYAFVAASIERAAPLVPVDVGADWQSWRDEFVADATRRMDDGNDWVLSSEMFGSRLGPKGIVGLRRLTEELGFAHARVVLYVQRQDRLAAANHVADVRAGHRPNLDLDAEVENTARYDWRRLYEWWTAADAFDDVEVRLFPDGDGGDVAVDFAGVLGGPVPSPGEYPGEPVLGRDAVEFLRTVASPAADLELKQAEIERAARRLSSFEASPFTLSRGDSERLMRAFAEPNAWILERVAPDSFVADYFAPDPALPEGYEPLTADAITRLAGRLVQTSVR